MGTTAGTGTGTGMSHLLVLEQLYDQLEAPVERAAGSGEDLEAEQLHRPRVEAARGGCTVVAQDLEAEELPHRELAELERVERHGEALLRPCRALAGPERLLERERLTRVLEHAVLAREAQRAHQHAVAPYRVGAPVHDVVHGVQVERAADARGDEVRRQLRRSVEHERLVAQDVDLRRRERARPALRREHRVPEL